MWKKNSIVLILVIITIVACNNDDGLNIEIVPPLDLSEVAVEDEAEIQEFLATHFYNYEEFQNPPADFDFQIVIDTIAGDNADKIPLADQVTSKTITVRSEEFALDGEEEVPHTLYYLVARQGEGESPSVADSTFVRYRGSLLSGTEFDGSFTIPVWFDLAGIQGPLQGARGFAEAMPNFKSGGQVIENPDGTFTVENYGIGLMIMPSGLGFFNANQPGIPAYSPIFFTVDRFAVEQTDHDDDGIPSIMEDLNEDGYLYNDNTDEAEEEASGLLLSVVNFLDADDDQDSTPTRDEIEIDEAGNITFPDSDGDGTPDYLDPDS